MYRLVLKHTSWKTGSSAIAKVVFIILGNITLERRFLIRFTYDI